MEKITKSKQQWTSLPSSSDSYLDCSSGWHSCGYHRSLKRSIYVDPQWDDRRIRFLENSMRKYFLHFLTSHTHRRIWSSSGRDATISSSMGSPSDGSERSSSSSSRVEMPHWAIMRSPSRMFSTAKKSDLANIVSEVYEIRNNCIFESIEVHYTSLYYTNL